MNNPKAPRRWRDYQSAAGNRPVKEFLNRLREEDKAIVVAAMVDVRQHGLQVARHLRGDIYEVRAEGERESFRILFAKDSAGWSTGAGGEEF